ncbi:MAG: hypothetical protein KZQ85_11845 [Candidatus Thiodiazotropha sp. (ex Myrtea sp. 'scaly one' KF741663)]|nr:hypothetical protein [Candidatus Thiodiazotropha sp. (ex Myrtea sp. 'scaly one' KF741663)]
MIFRSILLLIAFFMPVSSAIAGFEEGEAANREGDRDTAFAEYQAAAMAGDDRAYGKLGSMYLYGLGTERDYSMAYVWFGMSKESGDKYGERFQETAASVMTAEEVRQAEKLLNDYRKQLPSPEDQAK